MDLSTIIKNRSVDKKTTTGINQKYKDIDLLYAELSGLCNSQFKLWYCKEFNRIGRERVLVLASQARADGNDQVKLFSHLLKKESGGKVGVI